MSQNLLPHDLSCDAVKIHLIELQVRITGSEHYLTIVQNLSKSTKKKHTSLSGHPLVQKLQSRVQKRETWLASQNNNKSD